MKPATYNVDEHLATCRLTINHAALCENWRHLDAATPTSRTAAVVKANGYGLGLSEVGLSLAAVGCEVFFVATPDEGVRLRRVLKSREIFVFSGLTTRNAPIYAESNLIPVLNSLDDIAVWAEFWKLRGSRRPCALQIDTGMNRLGLGEEDLDNLGKHEKLVNSVNIITVLSHLARADEPDNPMNQKQLKKFRRGVKLFKGSEMSLANSAGIHLGQDYHFNLVRPGIALYGGEFFLDGKKTLNSVVGAEAKILQIRNVKKGEVIGYSSLHKFTRNAKVAIVAAGYGDGYLRSSSGNGKITHKDGRTCAVADISGYKVPILGRVSMDYSAFDVSEVPEAILQQAEYLELFGDNIKLDDAARAAGTNGYEFLTSIGQRYYRNHINQPEHSPNSSN